MSQEHNEKRTFAIRIDGKLFHLSNPEPTGRELLALIGRTPDKYYLTLQIVNAPDRTVETDEPLDISDAEVEEFTLVSKARYFAIRIDEQSFEIENPTPTGRELLALAGETPEKRLLSLSLVGRPDDLIGGDETVDVRQPGREQFFVIAREPLTILLDDVKYTPSKAEMLGSELRQLPVPPVRGDRDLWLDVPGKDDTKVEPAVSVKLKDGMVFYTSPAKINPGA